MLFRLHLHFPPKMFLRFNIHLFADDLVILIKGFIEKRLSDNISQLGERAKITMRALGKFPNDILLPVNINKTKVMLFHSAVAPEHPKVFFDNVKIEYVPTFKYLGIEIRCKLGWELYIENRIAKSRNI